MWSKTFLPFKFFMFSLKLKQSTSKTDILLKCSSSLHISPTGNITTSGYACLLYGVKFTVNLRLFHQLNHVCSCLSWLWWAQAAAALSRTGTRVCSEFLLTGGSICITMRRCSCWSCSEKAVGCSPQAPVSGTAPGRASWAGWPGSAAP